MKKQLFILVLLTSFLACGRAESPSMPKPRAYPRVERVSESVFHTISNISFAYPIDAELREEIADKPQSVWFNMEYPQFNATLYCTYMPIVRGELEKALADNQRLLHMQVDSQRDIEQQAYSDQQQSKYAVLYTLATKPIAPLQFYVTDSVSYFLRGSLYYNVEVNSDSVRSVTQALKGDVVNLIESLKVESTK